MHFWHRIGTKYYEIFWLEVESRAIKPNFLSDLMLSWKFKYDFSCFAIESIKCHYLYDLRDLMMLGLIQAIGGFPQGGP